MKSVLVSSLSVFLYICQADCRLFIIAEKGSSV